MLRSYLFEAAGVLLTRVQHWCKLKARNQRYLHIAEGWLPRVS